MYVQPNFKTKKALREALAAGQRVLVYDHAGRESPPANGTVTLEGPHYPMPHTWYGTGTMVNGLLTEVK